MENKFYITTAIDYVNDKPHLGHALEKTQADALARFARGEGKTVRFLTGTDEHGIKIQRAAEKAGKEPQDFVDENSRKFLELKTFLNLSNDDFIRTSDKKRHYPGVVEMWNLLSRKGDIYKKGYEGLYCVGHESFITEKDMEDGKCKDHQKEPELIREENYFFRLSKYTSEIKKKILSGELEILPQTRRNEILSLLEQGLEDVSFSRPRKDLKWGIPVPGDDTQTIYVWADALTNYLSAIGFGLDEDYMKWWPADAQIIGKDILRFHAAIWPGMLLSAGLPLPKKLLVHGFVTAEGQKMSKSIGNVVDPVELIKKYGTDAVRYYLLKEIPSGGDGDFSQAKFDALYNGDLANGLGNFASRVSTLAGHIDIEIKPEFVQGAKVSEEINKKIEDTKKNISQQMDEFKLNEALQSILGLISFGDKHLNEKKAWTGDWQAVYDLEFILKNVGQMLEPFLPDTAVKIANSMNWEGKKFKKIEPLFPRLA